MIPVVGVVDFHSHILPGLDHGSDSLSTSLYQLNCAKRCGVDKIVSTSHFYPTAHSVEKFVDLRRKSYESLLESGRELPEIKLCAEVLLCDGIDRLPNMDKLFLQGTNTLLLELPFSGFTKEYSLTVKRLANSGIDLILAHADRYSPSVIEELIPFGVKLQLNAKSLLGYNRFSNRHLFGWILRDLVVALGSDIHGRDGNAYRRLAKAFKHLGSYSEYIISESYKRFDSASKILI